MSYRRAVAGSADRAAGRLALAAAAALAVAPLTGSAAFASSAPVGPLPKGPVYRVKVLRDATFVIRAPKRPANSGLVWRVARRVDPKIVRQVGAGEDRLTVWLRFKAVGAGKERIVLALTKGETQEAFAARTWAVAVREPAMS